MLFEKLFTYLLLKMLYTIGTRTNYGIYNTQNYCKLVNL